MLSAVTVNDKYLGQLEDDDIPHFVFFYVSWSKYCTRVAPVWEEIADKYNNMEPQMIVIGKTDCLMEKHFCEWENVTGYPGLKYYKKEFGVDREEGVKYVGDRDFESMELFIKESLGLAVDDHDNHDDNDEDKFLIEEDVYMLTNKKYVVPFR